MICPYCNKETDSYTCIKVDSGVNLNQGCAGGMLNYTYTLNNAAANAPMMTVGASDVLNLTGCANQGALNTHYHVI